MTERLFFSILTFSTPSRSEQVPKISAYRTPMEFLLGDANYWNNSKTEKITLFVVALWNYALWSIPALWGLTFTDCRVQFIILKYAKESLLE